MLPAMRPLLTIVPKSRCRIKPRNVASYVRQAINIFETCISTVVRLQHNGSQAASIFLPSTVLLSGPDSPIGLMYVCVCVFVR